jgi:hypothetical protein
MLVRRDQRDQLVEQVYKDLREQLDQLVEQVYKDLQEQLVEPEK